MTHARFYLLAALLVAALVTVPVLLWGSAFGQDKGKEKDAAPAVKWEYKIIHLSGNTGIDSKAMETSLNDLGKEGWECVGTVSEVKGGSDKSSNRTDALLICKRPKK